MNIDNESRELSYYRLTLLAFLKESHPEKVNDTTFISVRAEIASQAYSDAIDNGFAIPLAVEMANEALFEGLHFSKHDTLINIIWNEFSDDVPQGAAKAFAEKMGWRGADISSIIGGHKNISGHFLEDFAICNVRFNVFSTIISINFN